MKPTQCQGVMVIRANMAIKIRNLNAEMLPACQWKPFCVRPGKTGEPKPKSELKIFRTAALPSLNAATRAFKARR